MPLVAGVDSSTQSCKVLLVDADSGEVVDEAAAAHPEGTEVHPEQWWAALREAGSGLLRRAAAVAVAGQQHGMIALDDAGSVVRPALLWNDTRSSEAARDLVTELGGPQAWADAVGSVPVASYTVTKLRWLAVHEPENARRVASVVLPHDWLTWQLGGRAQTPVTDRGDASGTGYWAPREGRYRTDLLALAFGRELGVPDVLPSGQAVGEGPHGQRIAAGTGDNMAAALGVGLAPGDVALSLGTSGTAFTVSDTPTADGAGLVSGFADATGRFLPLVCTLNAARVLSATATMLGTDLAGLDALALSAAPGAGGLVMLPYLDGERTPDLPRATGALHGMTRTNMTPQNLARAAVEGMLCGLADGIDVLAGQGALHERVMLLGGAAASRAVQQLVADIVGVPVTLAEPHQYVARGAARLAAWSLLGGDRPPPWPSPGGVVCEPTHPATEVRMRYARAVRGIGVSADFRN